MQYVNLDWTLNPNMTLLVQLEKLEYKVHTEK